MASVGNGADGSRLSQAPVDFHPVCIRETEIQCDVGDVAAAEACWDSGPEENGNGLGFVLYYMGAASFPDDGRSGARQYQQICEAAGLHTFCAVRNSNPLMGAGTWYREFHDTYGCLPGGTNRYVWGGWAGSEDNADFIPASIGWDAWMIHGEGDTHRTLVGYAADGSVHYNDNRDSPQWDQTAQLHPICVREK